MSNVLEIYGSMVFNDHVMKEKLPREIYKALKRTIETGRHFDIDVANAVANAMKEWALSLGATHFTHWFQPMTGVTAEKHDSFIAPQEDGRVIMEFSGRELIKGEPDASSFPSGGLRVTFEARGYTAWDPTSYAFIKDSTLYIPTAFCSYGGEALDKKTPLLRSMDALDKQAKRILALFGEKDIKRVVSTVGAEQEYFLIDKAVYEKRPDLIYTGRTLIGARPPKGQEMEDHYFGAIKPRVAAFMKEAEEELWKLGVPAKTKHNEVAPGQHEIAPVFSVCNVAADQNQLTMEILKSAASKFNLVCLLHEKPFASVNGSGKHNNWSLSTDTGLNLFEPGATPSCNARFLLFLAAVIRAVDEYQDLLRISVSSAGNDHRLGANEAPPAIVSMFLGEELTEILESLISGKQCNDKKLAQMEIGVAALPHFPRDTTDRNRTSPFAFTGNKFEFRMLGSGFSIADSNIVLNTIAAETLCNFADTLEQSSDFIADLNTLIKNTISAHKRIIFNGNNYSPEWTAEAGKRGLLNLKTTVDALPLMLAEKNIHLFTAYHVYSETEIRARYEILLENYCKTIHIEALTMIDMVKKEIIPSVLKYQRSLAETIAVKKAVIADISAEPEKTTLAALAGLASDAYKKLSTLEASVLHAKDFHDILQEARYFRESVFSDLTSLRASVDGLEIITAKEYWPYPSYAELLYSVR